MNQQLRPRGEDEVETAADGVGEQAVEKMLAWAGNALDKDILWGREALNKILSRLGVYQREST